jgi:hypothetical protein
MAERSSARGSKLPVVDVQEHRDNESVLGLDPETIDPGKHYRWVNATPQRVARHKMRGYRLVSREDGVVPIIPVDDAGDSSIRVGDMVLMQCDVDAYKARRQLAEDKAISRTKQPANEVKAKAKRKGIRTFVKDPDEDEDES